MHGDIVTPTLGANDSIGVKGVLHQLKELGLEQGGSRTYKRSQRRRYNAHDNRQLLRMRHMSHCNNNKKKKKKGFEL